MGTAQQHNVLDIHLTEISVTCKNENFLAPGSYLEISDVAVHHVGSVLAYRSGLDDEDIWDHVSIKNA